MRYIPPPDNSGETRLDGAEWQLVFEEGPDAGAVYKLGVQARLGRAADNDFELSDSVASRNHILVQRHAAGYTVEDLESSNGTLVNGERLDAPVWLENGDTITIGETVIRFSRIGTAAVKAYPEPLSEESPLVTPAEEPISPAQTRKVAPILLVGILIIIVIIAILLLT
jgi:pSer/pThr/pTyr-binding forkhead associated (FHA) protein